MCHWKFERDHRRSEERLVEIVSAITRLKENENNRKKKKKKKKRKRKRGKLAMTGSNSVAGHTMQQRERWTSSAVWWGNHFLLFRTNKVMIFFSPVMICQLCVHRNQLWFLIAIDVDGCDECSESLTLIGSSAHVITCSPTSAYALRILCVFESFGIRCASTLLIAEQSLSPSSMHIGISHKKKFKVFDRYSSIITI
jgi:hypothetical protein